MSSPTAEAARRRLRVIEPKLLLPRMHPGTLRRARLIETLECGGGLPLTSAEIEQMAPRSMAMYGTLCGWTLARAHARSGDRVAIAAYLGNSDRFDRAILEFSKAYAEQNERDYNALAGAVESGRITAETGL